MIEYDDKTIDDLKSMLRCIEVGMSSNFKWCLDCTRDDCVVKVSCILYKNY